MGLRQQLKKYLPTTTDKAEGEALLGRVRSVQEYFEDLADVVESTGLGGVVEGAMPIAGAVGEALAETLAPVKFLVKLFGKLTEINDPNELAYRPITDPASMSCRVFWAARSSSTERAGGRSSLPTARAKVNASHRPSSSPMASSKAASSEDSASTGSAFFA